METNMAYPTPSWAKQEPKSTQLNVMLATPAYAGRVDIPYALSLSNTMHALAMNNIKSTPLIVTSGSLLVAERNRLIQAFWESDCTHILCIDADLGWPAEAVLAMLKAEKEFIAGLYPARAKENVFLFRPVNNPNGSIVQEGNLLKMSYIPAGFMLISREAIRKMRDKHPDLYFCPKEIPDPKPHYPIDGYCFFNTEVRNGEFWGEDYVFCRLAMEAGIDIWVDPMIQFDHAGKVGMFIETLTQNPPK